MGRRRAAMRLFSVDELDKDTRALLYDVLHPHQRKAVIRNHEYVVRYYLLKLPRVARARAHKKLTRV